MSQKRRKDPEACYPESDHVDHTGGIEKALDKCLRAQKLTVIYRPLDLGIVDQGR